MEGERGGLIILQISYHHHLFSVELGSCVPDTFTCNEGLKSAVCCVRIGMSGNEFPLGSCWCRVRNQWIEQR